MNILHVVPSFGLGGMEKVICAIINSTGDAYQHALLPLDNNAEALKWINANHCTLLRFTKSNKRSHFFRSLYHIIHQRKPHVLMTYNWGATDAIWLGRLCGIRHIIHSEHGFNIDEAAFSSWKRDLVRFFVYHMSAKTVVVSRALSQTMRQRFYLRPHQLVWIPNGINTAHYIQNLSARKSMRTQLSYKDTDFVIGFSGRLDPVKNFDLMINIFAHCLHNDMACKLLIIGDGPEKNRLDLLCTALGLREHVLFVGQQDEVLPYLRALDAFLLTSHSEQMPLTILEAMSVGIPVVASQVGEIPHLIDDALDGFLVSPHAAPGDWAARLLAIKRDDAYADLGNLARKKILDKFQEKTMVKSYNFLIQTLMDSRDEVQKGKQDL